MSITEDSILKVFDDVLSQYERRYERVLKDVFSVPKGYVFPRFYLFYDELNINPLPSIIVQYLDTVNLRILDREIQLGYPYVKRWGWGFLWNPLNPSTILAVRSSTFKRDYLSQSFKVSRENLKTNLKINLRILANMDSAISSYDSAINIISRLRSILDTLRSLRRVGEKEFEELSAKMENLLHMKKTLERKVQDIRDSLQILLGIELRDIELSNDFSPKCAEPPESLKVKSLRDEYASRSLWWFPKVYLFGEFWNGSVRYPSAMYGFRVVLEFDETKRLMAKANKSIYEFEVRKNKGRSKDEEFQSDGELLGVLSSYNRLLEITKSLYDRGAISYMEYVRIYLERLEIRLKVLNLRVGNLKNEICEVSEKEYEKSQYHGDYQDFKGYGFPIVDL